jgi:cytochrome c peroxidase
LNGGRAKISLIQGFWNRPNFSRVREGHVKPYWIRRATCLPLAAISLSASAALVLIIPNLKHFRDKTGAVATFSTGGNINEKTAFFQSLGTNGRTCATCHQPDQAFSLSAKGIREVYERTHGTDPLFAAVDGANCPSANPKDRAAHSLLLERGLIRVGITLPEHPEFTVQVVRDPYGCAVTTDPATGRPLVSVYRRPLPSTNLRFLSAVMFDGRETAMPLNNAQTYQDNLYQDLTNQAISAVQTHFQGQTPSAEKVDEIVRFEEGLFTAQIHDDNAGSLAAHQAGGGPMALAAQEYYPGMNDVLGGDPEGDTFNPKAFSIYAAWEKPGAYRERRDEDEKAMREIAAGEKLFNTAPLVITGVRGLNDNKTLGNPASIAGTCTTCHDSPNVGNHSVALPLDIATSRLAAYETDPSIYAALRELSAPELPIYEITGCPDPSNPGETVNYYTSDPGKGLITGLCADVNRGKGPILRGLAARAPYFHNGAAANLEELVNFYNQRFQMNLSSKEKKALVAFLNSL